MAASSFQKVIDELLDEWLTVEESLGGKVSSSVPEKPIPPYLLELKVRCLRLAADQALWGESPWRTKGEGFDHSQKHYRAAEIALGLCERALRFLDAIREEDRSLRSYFYSLKGRALYLIGKQDDAYREFDLARAGFAESTPNERETLAVTLLRQAECLMVHSDDALTLWVKNRAAESLLGGIEEKEKRWSLLLSSEGMRKQQYRQGEVEESLHQREAERLVRLSLANFSPEILNAIEKRARAVEEDHQELVDILGTMRSRLAAANDLLDRVEGLLESSRNNVEWWACLFQLRTQLVVERLLLLISGDLLPTTPELKREVRPRWPPRGQEGVPSLGSLRAWLQGGGSVFKRGRLPTEVKDLLDNITNPMDNDKDLQRRFINRFQELLRQGVMAVRQGLDIVLPSDPGRRPLGRLEHDVLLERFLRTWADLMVCGAYATEMSQFNRPDDIQDDNVKEQEQRTKTPDRWEQWCHLNWLAGLTTLPRCNKIKDWFNGHDWGIGPSGLASRARTLARMDLCMISEKVESEVQIGTMTLSFKGGNSTQELIKELGRRRHGERQEVKPTGPRVVRR